MALCFFFPIQLDAGGYIAYMLSRLGREQPMRTNTGIVHAASMYAACPGEREAVCGVVSAYLRVWWRETKDEYE